MTDIDQELELAWHGTQPLHSYRRVETPGGAKWFELPIGSIITKQDPWPWPPNSKHAKVKGVIPKHSHKNIVAVEHALKDGEHVGYVSKMVGPMAHAHANEPFAVYDTEGKKVGYAPSILHGQKMLSGLPTLAPKDAPLPLPIGLQSTITPQLVYQASGVDPAFEKALADEAANEAVYAGQPKPEVAYDPVAEAHKMADDMDKDTIDNIIAEGEDAQWPPSVMAVLYHASEIAQAKAEQAKSDHVAAHAERIADIKDLWADQFSGTFQDAINPSVVEEFKNWAATMKMKTYSDGEVEQALHEMYPSLAMEQAANAQKYKAKWLEYWGSSNSHQVLGDTPSVFTEFASWAGLSTAEAEQAAQALTAPSVAEKIIQGLREGPLSAEALAKRIAAAQLLMSHDFSHVGREPIRPTFQDEQRLQAQKDKLFQGLGGAIAKKQAENAIVELMKPFFDGMTEDQIIHMTATYTTRGGQLSGNVPEFFHQHGSNSQWLKGSLWLSKADLRSGGATVVERGEPGYLEALRHWLTGELVHTWATTSNDDDVLSLSIQELAMEMFGIEPSDMAGWQMSPDLRDQVTRFTDENRQLLETFMRAQYANTQTFLRDHGLDSVQVLRAMRFGSWDKPEWLAELNVGESAQVPLRPLSATTTESEILSEGGFGGYAFAMEVPASKVLGIPGVGFGCWEEFELVVIGGNVTVTRIE